ncbi:hypothetical protein [Robertkochia solimangrovi]|uniref:hypothetical protein n=1 Tax=Robertkochia solimangrovi TaxID=2213046 RepID=UPI001181549F|nr:hypothetical protein [Robertkochia solimangrovi]TRZ44291.1 hypothetical protein DMZ48_07185 [Robertkochia solimangrovi]
MTLFGKSVQALIIGGMFLLLPLILIIFIVGKAIKILTPFLQKIVDYTGIHTVLGAASLTVVGIIVLVLMCILGGLLLQRSMVREWSSNVEEKLYIFFPGLQRLRYQYLDRAEEPGNRRWRAGIFREDKFFRIGFLIDKDKDGYLTIYLPDAPKMDAGELRFVKEEDCEFYEMPMRSAIKSFHKFGMGVFPEDIMKGKV